MRRDCLARRDDEGTAGLSVPIQQRRNTDYQRMALANTQNVGTCQESPGLDLLGYACRGSAVDESLATNEIFYFGMVDGQSHD
jgi:hypothetical protein